MCLRWMMRATRLGALGLAALAVSAAPLRADEEGDRLAYDRNQLIEQARRRPVALAPAAEKEVRESITAQRGLFERVAPDDLAVVGECLGESPEQPGLVHEGVDFYRWLTGAEGGPQAELYYADPDDPSRTLPYADVPEDDPRAWLWDIRVKTHENGFVVGPPFYRIKALLGPQGRAELRDIALTGPHEPKLRTCRRWVEAREKQVAPRVRAFQAEQPADGLVNDVTVSSKKARTEEYAKTLKSLADRKADMIASLDRLVPEARALSEAYGVLGFELDDVRGRVKEFEAKKQPLPEDLQQTIAKLRLKEVALQQRGRLLDITVRRADTRLALYDQAIRQVKEEQLAASAAYQRFEAEFSRLTRMRQLDRLAAAYAKLYTDHERVHAEALDENKPESQRKLLVAYDEALEALLVVNEATARAVKLRRTLDRLMKPELAKNGKAKAVAETAPASAAPKNGGNGAAAAASQAAPDPLRRFRDPQPGSFDLAYVRDALSMVGHPDWDADLAARQYAVVDQRIKDLERAQRSLRTVPALEAQFEQAKAQAEKALADALTLGLAADPSWWRWRIRNHRSKDLEVNEAAFRETVKRIRQDGEAAESELANFRRYRRELLDLGDRSFRIRVQSDLDGARLLDAGDDVVSTARDAGRWLTFQGSDHLGSYVARNWLTLISCVAVLLGALLGVRYGRKALERIARRMASRVPALRAEPVTVRAEEAEAKRSKAVLEAAAREAEEAALREVSKEEAAKAQRMGEGGYGG